MKNQGVWIFLIIMVIFASILIGFFLGRNTGRAPIQVSKLPETTTATDAPQPAEKININTADAQTLETLPGIGPVLAQRIVDDRNANGLFKTITELTRVTGIGVNLLDEIMDQITV